MFKLNFKPFKKSNETYIWKVYTKAMKPHIENIWGWDLEWQKNNFKNALAEFKTEIIEFENKKIGYVQYLISSKSLYINMLILEPHFQSQGIGARIINKIISVNPELPIELRCFRVNNEALNFYLNNGFEIVNQDNEFYTLTKYIITARDNQMVIL